MPNMASRMILFRLMPIPIFRTLQPIKQISKNMHWTKSLQYRIRTLPTSEKLTESEPSFHIPNKAITDSEREFLRLQNDPDKFGSSQINNEEEPANDPDDLAEEDFTQNLPKKSQKLRTKQYADIIKDHLERNRIKEALDVLEVRMLKEDRVKPENYIYNLLISGCAKAGFSGKAFQLFNKMKQRGLKVTGGTYTSLFNACSTAPWPQDGLNKANRLREIMHEKGYTPNASNYNAMIKAYGRCGDLQRAFLMVDEMISKNMDIRVDTFNFVLQGCASDKELGFRHALIVWHKMLKRGLKPDIYSFKSLLRCVRDCSIGDVETMEEVFKEILDNPQKSPEKMEVKFDNVLEIGGEASNTDQIELEASSNELDETKSEKLDATPNLLSATPHLGSLVTVSAIRKPEDRLLLLGGFSGFLEEMKKAQVTPGIEIFTQLVEIVPSTLAMEKKVIAMIRKIGLKSDIDFFNILIKKRSMRFDYEGANEVLSMIRTAKLYPDIVTYGVLALSCQTQEEARELLHKMHENGLRMNIQILGAMLKCGCSRRDFAYVNEILQIVLEEEITPNEEFLRHLRHFYFSCLKMIENNHPDAKSATFRHNFNNFKQKLGIWYKEYEIENLTVEDAAKKLKGAKTPYDQFNQRQPEGYEEIKNEKLQRKKKDMKYIRRIKLDILKEGKNKNFESRASPRIAIRRERTEL